MTEAQPGLPGMVSDSEHEADLRAREDDPTPRGVVRAVLLAAMVEVWRTRPRHLDSLGLTVLDVCAGYGAWASELRLHAANLGYPVHITGAEIDERKREHLTKWCDEVRIGDWPSVFRTRARGVALGFREFDLVIGNPHFSALTHEDPEHSMPAVLLRHAPAVLLLHTQQAFLRSVAGRAAARAYPPAREWRIPGTVSFRSDGRGDLRCYVASLWLRGHDGPTVSTLLPELTTAERRWVKPPGTEDVLEAKALGLPMVGNATDPGGVG